MKTIKEKLYPDMPEALEPGKWAEWDAEQKKNTPIRWFFADTVPDFFNENLVWPIERNYRKFKARWIHKEWMVIPRRLDKYEYVENDTLMIHSMFEILEKYVLEEKSHMWHVFSDDISPPKDDYEKFNYAMKHLDWEIALCKDMDLKHSPPCTERSQSHTAKETKELFFWWVNERPDRVDPYENMWYQKYHEMRKERGFDEFSMRNDNTPEEEEVYKKAMDLATVLEEKYRDEDEEMMIRLVKISPGMWT